MIAIALIKEEFDLLEELVIQIRTIQSLHDGNVFKKKAVDILENRIISDLRGYNEIILQTNPKPSSFTLHQDATANPKTSTIPTEAIANQYGGNNEQ